MHSLIYMHLKIVYIIRLFGIYLRNSKLRIFEKTTIKIFLKRTKEFMLTSKI